MTLRIVPFQLLLFAGARVHTWRPSPLLPQMRRERRTARQWAESVIAYCEWRAGEPWLRLSDPAQRWDPERWAYLDAARLIRKQLYSEPARPQAVLARPPRPVDPALAGLAHRPRLWLVDALLALDPSLTNRKILSRLSRPKLAAMLLERENALPERRRA